MKLIQILAKFISNKRLSRRNFIKVSAIGILGLFAINIFSRLLFAKQELPTSTGRKKKKSQTSHALVVVKGKDPYAITVKAIESLGGMNKFVKRGDIVVIKPNIGWDRIPEQAANTNPFVVAALIDLCFSSGAKRVNIFDRTCNAAQRCYENSGIKKAAEEKGAKVYFVDDWNFVNAKFNYDSPM